MDPNEPFIASAPAGVRARAARAIVAAIVLTAMFVGGGFAWRSAFATVGPGPAVDMLRRISVSGAQTTASRGRLLLTTASVRNGPIPAWEMFRAWADPTVVLYSETLFRPNCESNEELVAQSVAQIENSKLAAEAAAFLALRQPIRRVAGARVLAVLRGSPSDGKLRVGDLIVAVDGRSTADPDAVVSRVRAHGIGDRVRMTVRRGETRRTVTVTTRAATDCGRNPRPVIGASLGDDYRFPRTISIDTDDIGGPSGGLVFTLALIDLLSREDLTRGHTIAVTGELVFGRRLAGGEFGSCRPGDAACVPFVAPIGGVAEKVIAAREIGASTFVVPRGNAAEARAAARGAIRIIDVETVDDALRALRRLPRVTG